MDDVEKSFPGFLVYTMVCIVPQVTKIHLKCFRFQDICLCQRRGRIVLVHERYANIEKRIVLDDDIKQGMGSSCPS